MKETVAFIQKWKPFQVRFDTCVYQRKTPLGRRHFKPQMFVGFGAYLNFEVNVDVEQQGMRALWGSKGLGLPGGGVRQVRGTGYGTPQDDGTRGILEEEVEVHGDSCE